jgi:hypothetical protein
MTKLLLKITILVGMLYMLFLIFWVVYHVTNRVEFDSNLWKTSGSRVRGQMTSSLLRSKLLNGKNAEEVVTILGPPDFINFKTMGYEVSDFYLFWGFRDENLIVVCSEIPEIQKYAFVVEVWKDD